MKVVVTGGAGFIGSHLVDALVKRGDSVTVLDNFCSGQRDFLEISAENIEIHEVDLLNDDFSAQLEGAELVFHAAANPEVRIGETQPEIMLEQNVKVTERVLEAMQRAGVSNQMSVEAAACSAIRPSPRHSGKHRNRRRRCNDGARPITRLRLDAMDERCAAVRYYRNDDLYRSKAW